MCDDARVSEDVVAVAPLLARARCAGAPRVASDTIARPSEAPRCIEPLAGPLVACDEVHHGCCYANQTPALAVVLALIGDLIDKMQVDNTAAFKIDRGFESKIGFGVPKGPQIEAPKRQQ